MSVLPFVLIAALGWLVFRLRVAPLGRRAPEGSAADGGDAARAVPVALVVPARDEADNLPPLLDAISRLSPPPARIVVVDDHSTDGTGDLARAAGSTVVVPEPLPPGWLGKPWACAAGAAQTGDAPWLLFTDADTVHSPGSLGRAVALAEAQSLDLVSVMPWHRAPALWEKLQGVFQLLLVVATAAGARSRATSERLFCIGQYLLFRRSAYERVGGHGAVRNRVAEDVAFARRVIASGGRYGLLIDAASPPLVARMYPAGPRAFLSGWRRNFREGLSSAGLAGTLEISLVLGWLLGAPIACLRAALTGDWSLLAAGVGFGVLAIVEIARWQRKLGDFPVSSAFVYPLFALAFVGVSAAAAWDRLVGAPVRWRGREVQMRVPGAPS